MIKIIADSSCDVVDKMTAKNDLYKFEPAILPIILDNVEYIEDYTESRYKKREEYLEKMENSPNVPRTSAPSPTAFLELIENDDCDTVFIVCMSSKISATYSSAMIAKELHEDGKNTKDIYVIDSLSATAGSTNIILNIIEQLEKNIEPEQIFKNINDFVKNDMRLYIILKSLRNLEKNGRVKPAIAKLATLMSLRPICKSIDGEIGLAFKPHSSRAYKKIVNIITSDDVDFSNRILTITHIRAPEVAEKIKEEVSKVVNFKEIVIASDPTYLCINYGERGGILLAY